MLHAQTGTIEGRVANEAGAPLSGVNVVVLETGFGAATGEDGIYRIAGVPAGARHVAASAVGYRREVRRVRVEPDAAVRADFVLHEEALESDEVVVTASRRAQRASEVAASLSIVSPQDIERRHTVSLDDALRYVPGIQMTGNQVNVRGSSGFSYNTGSRVLLLVDGMPMLRPDADGVPYDAVPMSQVQRIEVLKGPGSALYGGGALGGVINVITRDYPSAPETDVEGYGGGYDPVRYEIWRDAWDDADRPRPLGGIAVGHARPLSPRSGLWVHASYRFDAGHLRLSRKESLQAYAKATWRPAADRRLTMLAGLNRRNSANFLYWNGARDALNPGRQNFGAEEDDAGSDDNLITELMLLPSYQAVISRDWLIESRLRIFGVAIQPLDETGRAKAVSDGTAGVRYGGEIQANYAPSSSRHVTVGITGDANATRSSFFERDDPLSQPEGALFVQWEESVSEWATFTAGGRYDVYRVGTGDVEHALSPRVSASALLGERWTFRAAYGEGFRVPSVAERFVTTSDYLPVLANLDLRPETSRSYELGMHGLLLAATGPFSLTFDAAGFWSDYRRLIEPVFLAADRAFRFVNLTHARVRGLEVTADLERGDGRVAAAAGYTLLDARDLSADLPLAFRSTHLLKASVSGTLWRLRLGADFRYASRPRRVDSDFALFIKDAELMLPTRVLDVHAGATWRGWRASLHVNNALDYYYLERPALLAPPRHVILRVATRW